MTEHYPQQGTNGFAIASLITGCLGVGFIAVILGHIGLSQIKRTGQDGRGLAIAGLCIGYFVLACQLALMVVFIAIAANAN